MAHKELNSKTITMTAINQTVLSAFTKIKWTLLYNEQTCSRQCLAEHVDLPIGSDYSQTWTWLVRIYSQWWANPNPDLDLNPDLTFLEGWIWI